MKDLFEDAPRKSPELVMVPFQPTVIVEAKSTEQLAEWERMFAEDCGMPVPKATTNMRPDMPKEWVRGETIGGCDGAGWDYCDYRP